jgi:hypothetical protein
VKCGGTYLRTILLLRCGFGSGFLDLACFVSDGCICANASRPLASTETSLAVSEGGMLGSPLAI